MSTRRRRILGGRNTLDIVFKKNEKWRKANGIIEQQPGFVFVEDNYVPQPITSKLDLQVNTTQVNFTRDNLERYIDKGGVDGLVFAVKRMIFDLDFLDNQVLFTNFGSGPALTNGVDIKYQFGSNTIFLTDPDDPIMTNKSFSELAYDAVIKEDAAATKDNLLNTRWSLNRFSKNGLLLDFAHGDKLIFDVKDDLTAVDYADINDFIVNIQGEWYIRRNVD